MMVSNRGLSPITSLTITSLTISVEGSLKLWLNQCMCLLLLVLMLNVSVCSVSYGKDDGRVAQNPVAGNASIALSEPEVLRLQNEALSGSGEAAYRLAQFYNLVLLQRNDALHWMTIAAENGSPVGIYGLGFMLRTGDEKDKVRAVFWLEKAKALQNEPVSGLAESLLKEMNRNKK